MIIPKRNLVNLHREVRHMSCLWILSPHEQMTLTHAHIWALFSNGRFLHPSPDTPLCQPPSITACLWSWLRAKSLAMPQNPLSSCCQAFCSCSRMTQPLAAATHVSSTTSCNTDAWCVYLPAPPTCAKWTAHILQPYGNFSFFVKQKNTMLHLEGLEATKTRLLHHGIEMCVWIHLQLPLKP